MGLNGLNREKPAQLKLFLGIMRTFGRTFCENAKCCHDAQSPKLLGANSKKGVGFHPKKNWIYPRCSMYGIFTYVWVVFGVNVSKYSI